MEAAGEPLDGADGRGASLRSFPNRRRTRSQSLPRIRPLGSNPLRPTYPRGLWEAVAQSPHTFQWAAA